LTIFLFVPISLETLWFYNVLQTNLHWSVTSWASIRPSSNGLKFGLRENLQETHIEWENLWFPVDFPLNQSIDKWVEI